MNANQIVAEVAKLNGITVDDMKSDSRAWRYSHPRQEAMWRLREEKGWSWKRIADKLNLLDHTTVIAGYRSYKRRLYTWR
ncbi:Chromosomal replication initiator, DnaA C-terminal [uncultured Caudovirales phage]|uniref:Chromosomal replication initiator, DnaA C-terminal n=1 Tax=uncultured Caudovirales phage TaxID=2100421 RepID=A0A6J5KNY4_9CAUD|nr:Chromosomal replication initiator, DnaA C-terminal [uncultured Caudovirales phage]